MASVRGFIRQASYRVVTRMTMAGPEPLDNRQNQIDREHSVLKQVKPVAEPVLEALGLEFEQVIGDSRQIDLYSLFDKV